MDKPLLISNIIKNLLALAEAEGITSPFAVSDVDECMLEESPEARMRCLAPLKHAIHEVLYAPPRRS